MTRHKLTLAERATNAHIRSLKEAVTAITQRPAARSSASLKVSAQGQLQPDVMIVAGEDPAAVNAMLEDAIRVFGELAKVTVPK